MYNYLIGKGEFILSSFDFYKIFMFFIIYSAFGWVIEVVFHIFTENKFINRGFLNGPICPIYGFGAISILLFLEPLKQNNIYLFIGGFIVASLLELVTGYILEKVFDTKWWDYSDEKFNIGGYISLKFSLAWGLVSVILVKFIHPYIQSFVNLIPQYIMPPLYNLLLIVLVVDTTLTVSSLIHLRIFIKDLVAIRKTLNSRLEEKIDVREQALRDRIELIYERLEKRHRKLLKYYPHITYGRLSEILDEIRERQ